MSSNAVPLLFHFLCLFLLPVFQLTYTPKRTMAGVLLPILPCKKINTPTTQPLSMLSNKNCKPNKWIHFKAHPFPSFLLSAPPYSLFFFYCHASHPHCLLCVYVCVRESSLAPPLPSSSTARNYDPANRFPLVPCFIGPFIPVAHPFPRPLLCPSYSGGAAVPLTDL